MKLPTERRCPWCGEVVNDIKNDAQRYKIKECKSCGKQYAFHYKNSIFLFSDIIIILFLISLACVMINKFISLIFCIILFIISIILQDISPYEMYDERVPILKRHRAVFEFYDDDGLSKADYLKIRLFLMEKAIVPICFIDDNNTPISHVVCVSIENSRKISNIKYQCNFAFLPLSPIEFDISKMNRFCIFDGDKKKVGQGRIILDYSKIA